MPKRTHDGVKKRCDCSKRRWPKCSDPWWFTFRPKEYRYSLDKIASARQEPAPTSKSDAVKWRDRLRNEIRFGTFAKTTSTPTSDARLTVADVIKEYRTRYVNVPRRRPKAKALFDVHLDILIDAQVPAAHGGTIALGEKAIGDVLKADIEAVREGRRTLLKNRPLAKGGECGINRLLSRARHLFAWAVAEGYTTETPFKRNGVTVIKLSSQAEGPRTRRLQPGTPARQGQPAVPGEEERLLKHADQQLRALIVAALSTGCRRDELLSLTWRQITFDEQGVARALVLEAAHTKTNKARVIPVGPRLRAELVMRRDAPDGQPLSLSAHVFGMRSESR